MTSGQSNSNEISELLQTVLQPLVEFALRHSITAQQMTEILKKTYVDAASREIADAGSKANVSRISVLTGIHRRDVRRLKEAPDVESTPTASISARVIGQWEQDPDFLTSRGTPRKLTVGNDDSEFRKLVTRVSKDVNPAAVLFDLKRSGAVEQQGKRISLVRRSYIINNDAKTTTAILAKDCSDLIAAVLANIESSEGPKHLHARTEYDNVATKELLKIQEALLTRGADFHREMRNLIGAHDLDLHPSPSGEGGGRVAVITVSYATKGDRRSTRP